MNSVRAQIQISSGEKVCHPSALKNTDAQLSLINSIILPHRIIIRADKAHLLPGDKSIRLKNLFKINSLRIGVSENSYTKNINFVVNKNKNQPNVVINLSSV